MADGPGKPVDHRLLVFVDMAVGMGNAVGVEVGMIMVMILVMPMVVIMVAAVFLLKFVGFRHSNPSLSFGGIIPYFPPFCNRGEGIPRKKFFDNASMREYNIRNSE